MKKEYFRLIARLLLPIILCWSMFQYLPTNLDIALILVVILYVTGETSLFFADKIIVNYEKTAKELKEIVNKSFDRDKKLIHICSDLLVKLGVKE